MEAHRKNTNDTLYDRLRVGVDLVSTMAGVAVSAIAGNEIGAYLGGVAQATLKAIFDEFSRRQLGNREEARVCAAVFCAVKRIESNRLAGKQIRQDDFFAVQPDGRSTAEEIAEGVLLASQREYEERKIPFYGNLLGNLAYTSEYDRAYCNLLLNSAEDMSYRQLCLLHVVRNNKDLVPYHKPLRPLPLRVHGNVTNARVAALQDLMNLHLRGFIVDSSNTAWLDASDATVDGSLTEIAAALYNLMELSSLRIHDVQDAARVLK